MSSSRALRFAAYGLGGLAAAIGLFLALLHTPAVKQFALREVSRILRDQQIDFAASALDYNLLRLRVDLRQVRVQSLQATDLPPLLTADRITANISLRKLIAGAYYIGDAAIENPQAQIVIAADGHDNLPRPPTSNKPSQRIDYLVRRLRISGGAVRFEDRRQNTTAYLPIESIAVDGDQATRNHRVSLRTKDGGQVTLAGRTLPIRGFAGDFVVEANAARIDSVRTQLGESSLTVSGRIDSFDTPRLDLQANASSTLDALAQLAGLSTTVHGNVSATFTAIGPPASLQATARVHGENLVVDPFEGVNVDAEAVFDAGAAKVRLESVSVATPWARAHGQGEIDLSTPARQSGAIFSVEGADLGRLSAILRLPVRVASVASAQGEAHWPGLQFDAVSADVKARVTASRQAPMKDSLPVDADVRATLRGNRVELGVQQLRAGGVSASGNVVLTDRKTLAGELRAEAPRLSVALSAAEAFAGKSLAGAPTAGSMTAAVKVGGTLSAPTAAADIGVRDLRYGDLSGIALTATGSYATDHVAIDSATATWRNQSVRASGSIGLGKQQSLRLTAEAEDVSVAAVLEGLQKGDLPLKGAVSMKAEVSGTLDQPEAAIAVEGAGFEAYQEPLGTLAARARLRGRQLELSELSLSGGPLRASGTYDLDAGRYQFQLSVPDWRLAGLTLPDGSAVRGAIALEGSGQGVADNPAANLKLSTEGLRIGDRELGRSDVTIQAANHEARVEAAAPEFNLNATAKVGLQEPYPTTAQVRLQNSDLSRVAPLEGAVSAVIDATGDLTDYQHGTARAEVSSLNVIWNGSPIRAEGPLTAHYADSTLTLDQATLVAADSRVQASGALPLETGEGTIRLNASLSLPGIAHLMPSINGELAGTATLDGTIRGTLRRIDPDITIALDNGSFALQGLTPAVTGATLRAQIHDGAIDISRASASWGVASLTATGAIPFALLPSDLPVELPRRTGVARLEADIKGVDFAALPGMPKGVAGAAAAHLTAEAARPELESVKATVTFPELRATLDTLALTQDGASEVGLENGVIDVRHVRLTGVATELQLSGRAGLSGAQALDLRLDGKLDAALVSAFTDAVRARGATEIHAAVTGSMAQPQAKGFVQLADGQFSMADPRVGVDGLNLRVDLDGTRATVSKLEGQINGGTLSGQGSIAFADGTVQDSDLSLRADDFYLDFPAGLKTVSDVRLQLKKLENRLAVRGSVLIKEGGFTDDLNFDKGILAAVTAPRSLDLTEQRNPLLDSMRFNVSVVTQDPLVIQNNLAKAEISTQLVVLGSPYEPGLSGRLSIEEGSELTLQERKYEVTRGIITFTSDRRIEPTLDIEATTTASNFDITLRISGPPGATKTELTSSPVALPEPDILAILVTGKTLDEIRGQEFQVAQNQMLSYLTGRVGATVGRQLEKATGLSRVRVEPNLIAAEATPSARLTVGQDLTRQLHFVYSMDLVDSSDQIYIAEYDLTKRFVTRGVRQSDASYRFDFRHDLRFGGVAPPERGKRAERRIGGLALSGQPYFPEAKILGAFKAKPGDRYDFFKLRKGLDRVTHLYTNAGLLESSVRLRREPKDSTVLLNLKIDPGPVLQFVFEGATVPGGVQKDVKRVWNSGVFDTQRSEDAIGVLKVWLVGDHYLTPEIRADIATPGAGRKRVLFEIQRGPHFERVAWEFEGAKGLTHDRLRDVIESQKLAIEVYTKPSRVTELLTDFYREMGYLDAEVGNPRYELDGAARTGKVVFPVKEGPHYLVGEALFEGNRALTAGELAMAVPLPQGEGYRPVLRENALQRVREAYWARGYNDLELSAETQRVPERALVNLRFRITENARSVVRTVTIEGNQKTSEGMIRTQLEIKPGDPVNLQKVGNSRRKLYNTGAYSLVEIESAAAPGAHGNEQPVDLRVKVQEIQPFELRYGGFYDTERGPGGIVDFANRNSLGSARVLGFRGRYDSQLREARLNFSQPLLARFPLRTIASPYIRREITAESPDVSGFNVDRVGVSLQQEASLGGKMVLNYGYKIERTHTYDTGPDPLFDITLRVASLTSTFTRDTRDDLLDASKGSFLSHAIQFSPESLGSQVRFLKYFGQYFRYFPLQKPRVELFTNQVLRPRLVYATAARVGLGTGFGGQEIPLSERFFSGGGTTIRGFAQNSIGPKIGSNPAGGNASLILNNELRFPMIGIFDGVGFVDLGNVYPRVSNFSLTDIRKAAGAGIRVRTPWFLVRLDYGFNLDRRAGEPIGRLFFSIGQAF